MASGSKDSYEHLQWLCPTDRQVLCRAACAEAVKEEAKLISEIKATIYAHQSAIEHCKASSETDPTWFTLDVQDCHARQVALLKDTLRQLDNDPAMEPENTGLGDRIRGSIYAGYARTAEASKRVAESDQVQAARGSVTSVLGNLSTQISTKLAEVAPSLSEQAAPTISAEGEGELVADWTSAERTAALSVQEGALVSSSPGKLETENQGPATASASASSTAETASATTASSTTATTEASSTAESAAETATPATSISAATAETTAATTAPAAVPVAVAVATPTQEAAPVAVATAVPVAAPVAAGTGGYASSTSAPLAPTPIVATAATTAATSAATASTAAATTATAAATTATAEIDNTAATTSASADISASTTPTAAAAPNDGATENGDLLGYTPPTAAEAPAKTSDLLD